MSDSQFPYETWVEDALRGVLRRALTRVAAEGLQGEHHFYINFRTDFDGVEMPGFLRAKYPEEITIVLQHQFEDLRVDDRGFSVGLYFSGRRQQLHVPFDAVTSFADPSVNFGLQIGVVNPGVTVGDSGAETKLGPREVERPVSPPRHPRRPVPAAQRAAQPDDQADEISDSEDSDAEEVAADSAEVITLDAFRTKS